MGKYPFYSYAQSNSILNRSKVNRSEILKSIMGRGFNSAFKIGLFIGRMLFHLKSLMKNTRINISRFLSKMVSICRLVANIGNYRFCR